MVGERNNVKIASIYIGLNQLTTEQNLKLLRQIAETTKIDEL